MESCRLLKKVFAWERSERFLFLHFHEFLGDSGWLVADIAKIPSVWFAVKQRLGSRCFHDVE